jgi:DNA-binding transcriptional MerR regulator
MRLQRPTDQDRNGSVQGLLTIGKIATRAEISTDTIRYYEQEGLLYPARKSASGYRLYTEEALRRIRFIKQAQHCGFSLSEMHELLALKTREDACCDNVRSLAVEKKLELEHKIKALKAMSQALSELIATCDGEQRPLDECPILAALETSMKQRKRREPAHEH